jgi:transposase
MMKKPATSKDLAEKLVKNIRRKTRQTYSAETKIKIILTGLRGEERTLILRTDTDTP